MPLADCATLATALFTGAVYVTLVQHPARPQCSSDIAVAQWRPSYKRATVVQASFTLIIIAPTNKRLGDRSLDTSGDLAWHLLSHWGPSPRRTLWPEMHCC
jgi:hypothetical protein